MMQGEQNLDAQLAAMAREQGFPSVAAMEAFYMSRRRGVQGNALAPRAAPTRPPNVPPAQQPIPQQRKSDEGGLLGYILNAWRGATE